jgi:hypothetical protein
MIRGGQGGYNTKTGLIYEGKVDLKTFLETLPFYKLKEHPLTKLKKNKWYLVYYKNEYIADIFQKNALYIYLEEKGINWQKFLSKKLLPDNAIYVILNNTLFIIEVKYQQVAGSVDEKLQTCDFKRKQYMKLFSYLNYRVEYIYILNDWFKKDEYKDVLDYIITMGCKYYFNYLPLQEIGLIVPNKK